MSITWENDVETLEFSIDSIINLKDIVVHGLQKVYKITSEFPTERGIKRVSR